MSCLLIRRQYQRIK